MYKISIIVSSDYLENFFNKENIDSSYFNEIEIISINNSVSDSKYSSYDNYKVIPNEYSNIADSYNHAIDIANGEYILFLDKKDTLLNNPFNLFLDITYQGDYDIVTFDHICVDGDKYIPNSNAQLHKNHYGKLSLDNRVKILSDTILSSKLYKKSFLKKYNLKFSSNNMLYDQLFITECFMRSLNVFYLKQSLIKRELGEKTDYTFNNLTQELDDYYYLYDIIKNKKEIFFKFLTNHIHRWLKHVIFSNMDLTQRFDLFNYSFAVINETYPFLNYDDELSLLVDLINFKKFYEASDFSFLLKGKYDENFDLVDVNNRDIIMVFYGLEYEIGGMAKAIFNRSNILNSYGHNITLINLEPYLNLNVMDLFQNYKFIEDNYRKLGYIDDEIKLFNVYDYLSQMNTLDENVSFTSEEYDLFNQNKKVNIINKYVVEKIERIDDSVIYNYYSLNDFSEEELNIIESLNDEFLLSNLDKHTIYDTFKKSMVRRELYINNSLKIRNEYDEHYRLLSERMFSGDGFNFLTIDHTNKSQFILKSCKTESCLIFENVEKLFEYFLEYYCLKSTEKPFLINDCSGPVPSTENIHDDVAIHIGNLHSNPFEEEHCYGSKRRDIAILRDVKKLDALVTLTPSEQEDLVKEFKTSNIFVIPNTLNMEEIIELDKLNIEREINKFAIIARIAIEKNLADAIKAFNIVVKSYPDVKLHIYGRALNNAEKLEYDKLTKLIEEYDLGDNIIFEGHSEDVYTEVRTSIATLLVSNIEGMPMVIIESMMNKIPVISYDIHFGPRDVITNNVDGFVVKQYDYEALAEKIIQLVENPELSYTMGEEARKSIMNNYSKEHIYEKWINTLQKAYAIHHLKKYEDLDRVLIHENIKLPELNEKITSEKNKKNINKNITNLNKKEKDIKKKIKNKNNQIKQLNNEISELNSKIESYK